MLQWLLTGTFAVWAVATTWAQPTNQLPPADLTELSLRELMEVKIDTVYSASKRLQQTTEAPSSVSIVTAEEIKKYGHRTLADVLRSIRGLYLTYDRNYDYLGIRGFSRPGDYNTRMLLLINGHRLNDNIYDSASIGTDFILDVDLIDRVEVVRGPTSSLYGNNAFFGVINVITKSPAQMSGVEAAAAAGSFDAFTGRVSYGATTKNGVGLLLSGTFFSSEGPAKLFYPIFRDPAHNFGVAEHRDGDEFASMFGTLSFRDFTLTGAYQTREKQIPTAAFGSVFNDPHTHTVDRPAFVELNYRHAFDDSTELNARVSYDHYRAQANYPYDYFGRGNPGDIVLNHDDVTGEWLTTEIQASRALLDRIKLTLGVEYRNNLRQDQINFDVAPFLEYLHDKRSSEIVSLFTQGEIALRTNLLLSLGARLDHSDNVWDSANPRVGLIYTPWTQTTLKLLYGQAFRAPNSYETLFWGKSVLPTPDLVPEKIRTYEFVWEQVLPAELRLSASAYYYSLDDLITQRSAPGLDTIAPSGDTLYFDNVAKVLARGLELGLERHSPGGVMGRISYSVQRSRDTDAGMDLSNSPKHLAKLNLIVPLVGNELFGGFEAQYVSSVKTLRHQKAAGYWLVNATLFHEAVGAGGEFSASVYNLTNERFGHPGAAEHRQDLIEQDGRMFRVKLAWRF